MRTHNIQHRPQVYCHTISERNRTDAMDTCEDVESESSDSSSSDCGNVIGRNVVAERSINERPCVHIKLSSESSFRARSCLTVVTVVAACFVMYYFGNNFYNNEINFSDRVHALQEKFPSQNKKLWHSISSGVKEIKGEPPTPFVFLLLHNNNKDTSFCLARQVGYEVVQFLNAQYSEPIIIEGENLQQNITLLDDYGTFIETYKQDIKEKQVMIINSLEKIPATIAQTFHSLCDSDNPLVGKAAYLFTMQSKETSSKSNPTQVAEVTLRSLWRHSIEYNIMEPLITRITNVVYTVNLEARLPC